MAMSQEERSKYRRDLANAEQGMYAGEDTFLKSVQREANEDYMRKSKVKLR
ncbi:MAG: hypothetical protein PHU12_03995 [Candidatus Aenigmarchaeota archaeon]|nr:hypothetical protein [Candidatus Aenigmarchaeota archaeon]